MNINRLNNDEFVQLNYKQNCNLIIFQREGRAMHESLAVEKVDEILQSYPELDYSNKQTLKKFLCNAKIQKAFIRQNIVQQGVKNKKGILIIQGTVVISKKIGNGKMIFSQLNSMQIANIETIMYDRAFYTISVQSSELKYIQITESVLRILFQNIKAIVMEKEKMRNQQIQSKLKQVQKKEKLKDKQKMVEQLSLPALKYFSKQDKANSNSEKNIKRNSSNNNLQKSINGDIKKKSESFSKNNKKKNFDLKEVKVNKRQSKSPSQLNSPDKDRNQRIFKQQLKQIIKRKLIYERKQLGVLKAYRNHHNYNEHKIIYEQNHRNLQTERNQIDQYFKV